MASDLESLTVKALALLQKQYVDDDTLFNVRDNKTYWDILSQIKASRTQAIELGLSRLKSKATADRFFGITLLSEICNPVESGEEADAEMIGAALAALTDTETTLICKDTLASALGMTRGKKSRAALLKLSTDVNDDVRWSATTSLGHYTDDDTDGAVFARLVALSVDRDSEIREWATMWLGSCLNLEGNGAALEPILARLKDRHIGTKIEAVYALAEHNDLRALEQLKQLLSGKQLSNVHRVIEAAGLLGVPELATYLDGWKSVEARDQLGRTHAKLIDWALKRCSDDPTIRATVDDEWFDDETYLRVLSGGRKPVTYRS